MRSVRISVPMSWIFSAEKRGEEGGERSWRTECRCIFSVLSSEMSFGVVRDQLHFSVLTRKRSFGVICDQVACFSVMEGRWGFVRCPLEVVLILRYWFKGMGKCVMFVV